MIEERIAAAEKAFLSWWLSKTYRETALRLAYREAFLAGFNAGDKK